MSLLNSGFIAPPPKKKNPFHSLKTAGDPACDKCHVLCCSWPSHRTRMGALTWHNRNNSRLFLNYYWGGSRPVQSSREETKLIWSNLKERKFELKFAQVQLQFDSSLQFASLNTLQAVISNRLDDPNAPHLKILLLFFFCIIHSGQKLTEQKPMEDSRLFLFQACTSVCILP